jgi:hypothetical protein
MIQRAATGYLQMYRYLIQYESNFVIAKRDDLRLIPGDIKWPDFCQFIWNFDQIKDADISQRYHYGKLRLSRLNLYALFFFRKFTFQKLHGQYSDYFARFYGPTLFAFAVASMLLNSMQVKMAIEQVSTTQQAALGSIFCWASTVILVGTMAIGLFFWLLWLWIFCDK